MSSRELPTIVIVPGAFYPLSCFNIFTVYLQKAGYPTKVTTLPSLNPPVPSTTTCASDTAWFRENILIPLIENEEKEVLLLLHSYSGVPCGAAATGFGKVARAAEGKPGGVVGMIYLSGNIARKGKSLLQTVGAYPPYIKTDHPAPGLAIVDPAIPTLYSDVEPSLASALAGSLLPHSMTAFTTPSGPPAWAERAFDGRRAYVRCTEDACLPVFLQDSMLKRSGVEWDIRDLKASHSSFVSQAEKVSELVQELARKWSS